MEKIRRQRSVLPLFVVAVLSIACSDENGGGESGGDGGSVPSRIEDGGGGSATVTPPTACSSGGGGMMMGGPGMMGGPEMMGGDEIFPGHPYYHRVYRAVSPDGLTFTDEAKLLVDHASVPDAVLTSEGDFRVYFVNGEPAHHGIWVAGPGDDPEAEWERLGCVHIDGSFRGNAVDPDIMRMADGRYRLFYYGSVDLTGDPMPTGPHPVSSAVSEDGFYFSDEGVRIWVDSVTDPTAVQLASGRWLIGMDRGSRTIFADSEDGSAFSLMEGAEVPLGGGPELHALSDGRVRLYARNPEGIQSFISADEGRNWSQEPGTRLAAPAGQVLADASLVAMPDGSWVMFYKLQDMM